MKKLAQALIVAVFILLMWALLTKPTSAEPLRSRDLINTLATEPITR